MMTQGTPVCRQRGNRAIGLFVSLAAMAIGPAMWADPIHDAVRAGDDASVAAQAKANPPSLEARDADSFTPLHLAAARDAARVTDVLLDAGARTDALTADRRSPLDVAIASNAASVVALLIDRAPHDYEGQNGPGSLASLGSAEREKARALLIGLVREKPADERVNFAFGMLCMALRDYGPAQLAFERTVLLNPGNDRARLEWGRALLAGGQVLPARAAFAEVLARHPPRPVEDTIKLYLDDIDSRVKVWHVTARLDVGGLYDDNANLGPASDTIDIAPIYLGGTPLTTLSVAKESRPVHAGGVFAALDASATRDIGAPGDWMLTADTKLYRNWLDGASEQESGLIQGGVGLQRATSAGQLQELAEVAHIDSGGSAFLDDYGIRSIDVIRSSRYPSLIWMTPVTVDYRDYNELNDRDGLNASIGETARLALAGGRHAVNAGLTAFHGFARDDAFANTGISAAVGGETRFARWLKPWLQLRYTFTGYEEREPLAPEVRRDSEWTVSTGLDGLVTPRWGYDVQWQWTRNNSTFDLYQYDRNVVTISTSVRL